MITLTLLHPIQSVPVQVWTFNDEPVVRIGRSTDNHVILYSAVVSRYHVELRQGDGHWEVVNLGANGTYVDGKRITQVPITDGVIIRLARSGPNIQIHIGEPSAERAAQRLAGEDTLAQRRAKLHTATEAEEAAEPTETPPVTLPPVVETGYSRTAIEIDSKISTPTRSTPSCQHLRNAPNALFCVDCGQPLKSNQQVGDYRILRTLAEGGIGITYLAWKDGQSVVLKTLNDEWINQPKARELFEREAKVLQQLRHPGIPQGMGFFTVGNRPYLAMEMVYGQTLWQQVLDHGVATQEQVIPWMIEVCTVLDYLHSQSPPLLHRDIKPENLIRRSTPLDGYEIVVVDFGAVKELALETGTMVGSTGYSAPEQQKGNPVPASDLYAVGTTLVYLLTGQEPSKFYTQREQGFRLYAEYIPGLSPEMAEIIRKLTNPQPEDRYGSAHEVAQVLSQLL